MGSPVQFSQANTTWLGWPADADREAVDDLPVARTGGQSVSCWELTDAEVAEIVRTKRAWLHVWGMQHPPVCVSGHDPFSGQE